MTNEIIEFYREHLKPIIQKMLLETNYQGQGEVDYEEFGRDFDELLDLAIIGMQSNSDEDCISREEVCDYIAEFVNHEYATDREREMVKHIIDGIQHLSSVQPKPKTGHWIDMPIGFKCSKCQELAYNTTKYCPNCGARMENEVRNDKKRNYRGVKTT